MITVGASNVTVADIFDTGIELEQAHGTRVLHNTVIHPSSAFASISHRFANTDVVLANNLVRNIRERDGSTATAESNREEAAHSAPTSTASECRPPGAGPNPSAFAFGSGGGKARVGCGMG
jgi:hypothetical protein